MKYLSIILLVILASCNTKIKEENALLKEEVLRLQAESEKFKNQNENLTISISGYKESLKEIDENLKAIDLNATMVAKLGDEGANDSDSKEMILNRIASIKALMDNSKLRILALDRSLNEMRKKYGEQSEEVLRLNDEIKAQARLLMEKETEFAILKAEMEEDYETLSFSYEQQVALTEELGDILNRAFYFAGTSKELKEKEIVDTEGGFIGLGRVKVLNSNSKEGLFYQIKKDETNNLIFKSKSIKLITEHSEGSYSITSNKTSSELIILDKKEFWKTTNYLVVQL